jgi:hypothetical protein
MGYTGTTRKKETTIIHEGREKSKTSSFKPQA